MEQRRAISSRERVAQIQEGYESGMSVAAIKETFGVTSAEIGVWVRGGLLDFKRSSKPSKPSKRTKAPVEARGSKVGTKRTPCKTDAHQWIADGYYGAIVGDPEVAEGWRDDELLLVEILCAMKWRTPEIREWLPDRTAEEIRELRMGLAMNDQEGLVENITQGIEESDRQWTAHERRLLGIYYPRFGPDFEVWRRYLPNKPLHEVIRVALAENVRLPKNPGYARAAKIAMAAWRVQDDVVLEQYYPDYGSEWEGWAEVLPCRSRQSIESRAIQLGLAGEAIAQKPKAAREPNSIYREYAAEIQTRGQWDGSCTRSVSIPDSYVAEDWLGAPEYLVGEIDLCEKGITWETFATSVEFIADHYNDIDWGPSRGDEAMATIPRCLEEAPFEGTRLYKVRCQVKGETRRWRETTLFIEAKHRSQAWGIACSIARGGKIRSLRQATKQEVAERELLLKERALADMAEMSKEECAY